MQTDKLENVSPTFGNIVLPAGADFGGLISLYNEDCLQALKRYDDNHFDIAIVDPPYGIGISSNPFRQKFEKCDWDNAIPNKQYFDELMRVSKNQIIWGGNYFGLPASSCWLVWDKLNSGDFADCELAWTSFNTAVRKFTWRWNGMLQQNMKNKEDRIHPTQKPVALYKWILENYAEKGSKILDTHLGSGSIAIACWDMGYDLTAYEVDKEYFDNACKRLETHKAQLTLW